MLVKFNNEADFFTWVKEYIADTATIIEGDNDISTPESFPCFMTYNFIELPVLQDEADDEQYNDLLSQGYESDEINKFYYDFIYLSDFDSKLYDYNPR